MRRLDWKYPLALLAMLLVAPTITRAAESYDNCTGFITSVPATINTQGTWCLKQDLATAISSGNAITVNTNNVTIDCNDFKIGGLAAGAATLTNGIAASNRSNITVRHCNVRGFLYGLNMWGSGLIVEDSRFDGNTWAGMDIEGDGSVIRRNLVSDTGGSTQTNAATGIIVLDSADVLDNTVSGVTATGNGYATGINTQSNPNGTVSGNHVRSLVSAGSGASGATLGIYANAAGTSGRVVFRNNDVVGDGSAGSQGITCTGIVATGNGRSVGNVISAFASGIIGCSNDGGNVIVP